MLSPLNIHGISPEIFILSLGSNRFNNKHLKLVSRKGRSKNMYKLTDLSKTNLRTLKYRLDQQD